VQLPSTRRPGFQTVSAAPTSHTIAPTSSTGQCEYININEIRDGTNTFFSIEGSTIIIAATIPVLSPLMDKIFRGRNPFASSRKVDSSEKRRQYYYGDRSGSGPNDGTHPSLHSSKQRRPLDPLDPGMDLEETIRDYSSDEEMAPTKEKRSADVESQASTLGPRGSNSSEETHVAAGDAGLQRQDSLSNGQILRTNEVIVTYDTRDERQERLDRNIPWETQTYTDQWPLR
jgi:hypothetical protein